MKVLNPSCESISRSHYNLRKLKKYPQFKIKGKKSRSIQCLPDELLLLIFSFLPHGELADGISHVCRHWGCLASDINLWNSMEIGPDVPRNSLVRWLKFPPRIGQIAFKGRRDMNDILKDVAENCKEVEGVKVTNCRGSRKTKFIYSKPLCQLLNSCRSLQKIQFENTIFNSCRFFKLLALRDNDKCIDCRKSFSYKGPITWKSFNCLFRRLKTSIMINNHNFTLNINPNDIPKENLQSWITGYWNCF